MKRLIELIKGFFLFVFDFKKREFFDMLDEYEDYVRGQDISNHNTLVGTVRTREQYDVNFSESFYHIPARFIDSPDEIEYVALYRSKNVFGDDESGIIHYGRVLSHSRVKRSQITSVPSSVDADEYYYVFEVASWEKLDFHVFVKDIGPNVFLLTNFYFLSNSVYSYELFCSNNNEFKLNLALRDVVSGVYDGFFVGDYKIYVAGVRIILLTPKGKIFFKVADYKRHPLSTVKKLSEIIFNADSPSE